MKLAAERRGERRLDLAPGGEVGGERVADRGEARLAGSEMPAKPNHRRAADATPSARRASQVDSAVVDDASSSRTSAASAARSGALRAPRGQGRPRSAFPPAGARFVWRSAGLRPAGAPGARRTTAKLAATPGARFRQVDSADADPAIDRRLGYIPPARFFRPRFGTDGRIDVIAPTPEPTATLLPPTPSLASGSQVDTSSMGGSGCQTAPTSGGAGMMLAPLLLAFRRRRS
jgi:hypothetical protein